MKGWKAKESKWTTEIIKSFLSDLGKKREIQALYWEIESTSLHINTDIKVG